MLKINLRKINLFTRDPEDKPSFFMDPEDKPSFLLGILLINLLTRTAEDKCHICVVF